MQKNKGITLVSLIVTIIVLLIIAGISVGILFGDNGILTKVQEAADKDYLESTREEIKLQISEEIASSEGIYPTNEILKSILEKYGQVVYEADGVSVKGVLTTKGGYEILLAGLGAINTNSISDIIDVNYEIKSVSGNTYNLLIKVTSNNGIQKIVYKNINGDDITLTCDNKLEVDIDFQANPNSEYYFVASGTGGTEKIGKVYVEQLNEILADGNWNGTVNRPKLLAGMKGIYWDDLKNEVEVTILNQGNWYDYANKKWANAKTADGSYWVWIPRYEYKIPTPHSKNAQTIDINFIDKTKIVATDGYTINPAFTFGDTEIQGMWVAKFEISGASGRVNSKPNSVSWRSINIGQMFNICRNMENNDAYGWGTSGIGIDTHLIKNTEWGACAYLSSSEYGKAGEVWINPDSNYLTGRAGTSVSADATSATYQYNDYTYGVNASTTGNIYGVYDMSGGAIEYTASYVDNGNSNIATYGSSLINAENKYKDVYVSNGDTQDGNYSSSINKKGDAIYETSSAGSGINAWYSDYSNFAYSNETFFDRGGFWSHTIASGVFNFYRSKWKW